MNENKQIQGWHFVSDTGTFTLRDPHKTSYLYFPLVNEAGMISVITPLLHGDSKIDQNTFLLAPVSVEDLHSSRSARNFWVYVEGIGAWSATGNSALQIAQTFTDDETESVTLEAGLLWHKVTRESARVGLRSEITNFVPQGDDKVELMRVTLTNASNQPCPLTPTAAIPLYGRSADNLRDHRHVTSLLHRIRTHTHGVLVRPTLSFDERGHQPNAITYTVLGAESDGTAPVAFLPVVETFIGEGGTLDWPKAVVMPDGVRGHDAGQKIDGYEAMGGLRFQAVTLDPGESCTYILILAILEDEVEPETLIERYGNEAQFTAWLAQTEAHWEHKLGASYIKLSDPRFNHWMKWVTLQPVLRRICGNSFLPYHDYGRGGRGWRDLWQDLLALLIMEPSTVRPLLFSNFAGIRTDGSNATIIGSAPGEFKADRNDIPRVWMDHGAWPLLTTRLYIDHTGDLAFLLQDQIYFKDPWINRSQATDEAWEPEHGTQLKTITGEIYRGTILEHLLVQHLTAFFNVGEHNNIKLEGADWNDGMDMAKERGESVAFTAFYASNLRTLSQLVLELDRLNATRVFLFSELMPLLDTLTKPVDYDSVAAKQARLADYCAAVERTISGNKVEITLQELADDLSAKANWLYNHLRQQEWIRNEEGFGWFNGYYDDDGNRVEGDHPNGVRMTLTGQTFALMGGVATDEQVKEIVRSADRYLYDPSFDGYRLNTDFGEVALNLGRAFGFAFGHKENGAMFSHMAVMYANALYKRGLVRKGYKVLDGLYRHSQDFATSRMYPGLPEYISPRGRGMYPYLTGSASWYLLTVLTEVFGIKGRRGDLVLEPKLVREQFNAKGDATVFTLFANRRLNITYRNPTHLAYGDYTVKEITLNGEPIPFELRSGTATLSRDTIIALAEERIYHLDVLLSEQAPQ
jgi:cellobiose phosphorylase